MTDHPPRILSVEKIWDKAPHSAFTDLLRSRDRWWCSFREAEDHGDSIGTLRVLVSDDGDNWSSVAEVKEEGVDLRDPKLSQMPDGRLLLVSGGSLYDRNGDSAYRTRCPRVSFSDDGYLWTQPRRCLAEDHWLWRVTWHGDDGYSVSKLGEGGDPRRGFLYRTVNGLDWEWITEFRLPDDIWTVSETTLRIMPDEEMIALIRPDWIGRSMPPFVDWSFTQIEHRMGGPNFIRVPDGTLWACARGQHEDVPGTVLARMTPTSYETVARLPSSGDCSYAGMVWHDELLWISYYSTHEEKTSVYLARVDVS